jgi:hypothetical protein
VGADSPFAIRTANMNMVGAQDRKPQVDVPALHGGHDSTHPVLMHGSISETSMNNTSLAAQVVASRSRA